MSVDSLVIQCGLKERLGLCSMERLVSFSDGVDSSGNAAVSRLLELQGRQNAITRNHLSFTGPELLQGGHWRKV